MRPADAKTSSSVIWIEVREHSQSSVERGNGGLSYICTAIFVSMMTTLIGPARHDLLLTDC